MGSDDQCLSKARNILCSSSSRPHHNSSSNSKTRNQQTTKVKHSRRSRRPPPNSSKQLQQPQAQRQLRILRHLVRTSSQQRQGSRTSRQPPCRATCSSSSARWQPRRHSNSKRMAVSSRMQAPEGSRPSRMRLPWEAPLGRPSSSNLPRRSKASLSSR